MHGLDALLKPLILNLAIVAVIVIAGLIALPLGLLVSRRLFRKKARKTQLLGTLLLTGSFFIVSAAATTAAGLAVLTFMVIKPQSERHCAAALQQLARQGAEWAVAHDGRFPADFTFVADRADVRMINVDQQGRSDQDAVRKSYLLVTPGAAAANPTTIFLRCATHEHSVRVDGTIVAEKTRS